MAKALTAAEGKAGPATQSAYLLAQLARFAAGIRLEQVPKRVTQQAKLCILDTVGCIVAGSGIEEAQLLLASERGRNSLPEASVLCANTKLSTEAATRVNGFMGDILELNDIIAGHASIGNVTAALALAEARQVSGAQLLQAVITGIEVTARVYFCFYPSMKPYTQVGMATVGFPSTLGVAAGAAKLLGLDEERTRHAMEIAGALAGWCPAEVIFGQGGSIKPMLFGAWPGSVGLMAAQYAEDGLSGPPRLLESEIGYYVTVARGSEPRAVLDTETWHLATPRRKLHACCGYLHSALDALATMRREGARFQDAAEIRVGMPGYVVPAVSKSGVPVSANEARFHAQYCLAVAANGADVIAPDHSVNFRTFIDRPEIASMMGKIRIAADPGLSHYYECSVSLLDHSGALVRRRDYTAPKGSPANPMSDDEVRAKFRRLVSHRLDPGKTEDYLKKFQTLEQDRDWSWLVKAFDRPGAAIFMGLRRGTEPG